ncbi:MAG TPA: exodeoxyribonuclease VII large subunit [Phycisphaerae bacterium]|nr:exodeoxyribonuclease VII large subunit [Phycisphaerae bacterium]
MAGQRPIFDPDRIDVPRIVPPGPRTCTVSQLNTLIKRVLGDQLPGTIHLIGEISNLTRHTSGHLYITLKDDRGEIRCVMWRSAAATLKFEPKDGMEVVATGHVDVYEARGQYQFYIRKLEPKGTGALELAFRQLRERLEREGLFDPKHKKPIPRFPRHVALVTSPTGAAVHDMIQTLHRRFPCVRISLHPVQVQGEGAAKDIAGAISRLNRQAHALGGIDVLIVGRGGGSLENLWAFNEEVVARAIHASAIPVISAVGHEVDLTIADLVADLRAATPTAAAELAVPVLAEVLETLATHETRLRRGLSHLLTESRVRLIRLTQSPWLRDPLMLIRHQEQRLDETHSRLKLALAGRMATAHRRIHKMEVDLAAIQPHAIIRRRLQTLGDARARLQWAMTSALAETRKNLNNLEVHLATASPRTVLSHSQDRLSEARRNLHRIIRHRLDRLHASVETIDARLRAGSYRKTLARGYSITRHRATGEVITTPAQVTRGEDVVTETAAGTFDSRVANIPDDNDSWQES